MTSADKPTATAAPFQFSLGRLFAAIALFAVCLWLLRAARESPDNRAAAIAVVPLVLGLAVGSLLGRAGMGATATVVVYGALGLLLVQLDGEPLFHGRHRDDAAKRRASVSADTNRDDFITLMNIRGSTPPFRAVAAQER